MSNGLWRDTKSHFLIFNREPRNRAATRKPSPPLSSTPYFSLTKSLCWKSSIGVTEAPRRSHQKEKNPSQQPTSRTVFPFNRRGIASVRTLWLRALLCPGVVTSSPRSIVCHQNGMRATALALLCERSRFVANSKHTSTPRSLATCVPRSVDQSSGDLATAHAARLGHRESMRTGTRLR